MRSRCRVELVPDRRVTQREELFRGILRRFPHESRDDVKLLGVDIGSGPILRRIYEAWAKKRIKEILEGIRYRAQNRRSWQHAQDRMAGTGWDEIWDARESFEIEGSDFELAGLLLQRAEAVSDVNYREWKQLESIQRTRDLIEKIELIDQSLAISPAETRKVITVSKPTTIIEAARAKRLMVKAKKLFEKTGEVEILKDAALLAVFSEGETEGGTATAATMISVAASAPSEKLLDELSQIEERFEKLGKKDKNSDTSE